MKAFHVHVPVLLVITLPFFHVHMLILHTDVARGDQGHRHASQPQCGGNFVLEIYCKKEWDETCFCAF